MFVFFSPLFSYFLFRLPSATLFLAPLLFFEEIPGDSASLERPLHLVHGFWEFGLTASTVFRAIDPRFSFSKLRGVFSPILSPAFA